MAQKVHLISLGCARNRVDSEVMLGTLLARGWEITDVPSEADTLVVNTCGFIEAAKEESIDTILSCAEHKRSRPGVRLVVAGCLSQRYKGQLAKGLPEVDFFIGTDEFPRLADLLEQSSVDVNRVYAKRTHYMYEGELPRLNTLNRSSAYVKIAEGCQHSCAFCIIPAIRGKLRSRPIASVVAEVERLCEGGVKEINLIAQDLAAYGRDRGSDDLLPLLKELCTIPKLAWLRLLYMYPENISDEFLDFMATEPKLVKYLDIPSQHGHDETLKRMKRQVTRADLLERLRKVRERVPGIAIRTTVMVGFPGETQEEFDALKSFVSEARFNHLGCFAYSQEEGTVAGRMAEQIDEPIKEARLHEIMSLQQAISSDHVRGLVGQELDVLVTGLSEESEYLYEGRLATQAPEVDGVVYLNDGQCYAGEIQRVRITDAYDYDLLGQVVEFNPSKCPAITSFYADHPNQSITDH